MSLVSKAAEVLGDEVLSQQKEIRKRAIRVIANSGIFFLILTITTFAIPGAFALVSQIPIEGLTFASAVGLLLAFLAAFFGLRIVLDLIRLVDLTSDFLVAKIPGLKLEKRVSVVKALKEVVVVLVMIVAVSIASPFLLFVPRVGWLLQLTVSMGLAVPAVILLYDAGRTLYAIFQSGIEYFIDRLASGK